MDLITSFLSPTCTTPEALPEPEPPPVLPVSDDSSVLEDSVSDEVSVLDGVSVLGEDSVLGVLSVLSVFDALSVSEADSSVVLSPLSGVCTVSANSLNRKPSSVSGASSNRYNVLAPTLLIPLLSPESEASSLLEEFSVLEGFSVAGSVLGVPIPASFNHCSHLLNRNYC